MTSDRTLRMRARYYQRYALIALSSQSLLRRIFELDSRIAFRPPRDVTVRQESFGGVPGRLIRPEGETSGRLLYLHGGGFTIGSSRTHLALAAALSKAAGVEVFSPDYRLCPEHPFPAPQEDVLTAAEAFAPDLLAGDSAGGNLALTVALNHPVKALGLIAPIVDLARLPDADFSGELLIPPQWPRRIERALGVTDLDNPLYSPINADLSDLPPTLIHVSPGEVLEHDARALAEAAPRAELHAFDGLPHVWHLSAGKNAQADAAVAELANFLKRRRIQQI